MDIHPPSAPKPRRKRLSAARCCTYLCAVLGALVICSILGGIAWSLWGFASGIRNPHKAHFHNATSGAASVRPLLGPHDQVDVVLSIWARLPDEQQPWYQPDDAALEAQLAATANLSDLMTQSMTKMPLVEIQHRSKQVNLFSQVIFSDFSLDGPDQETTVKFDLPLQRFYDERLYNADVRVALSLLPRADILDGLVNVSDWRPYDARPYQRLPDGFIFPEGKVDYSNELQATALEVIANSHGIIRFHDIKSKCATQNETANADDAVPEADEAVFGLDDASDLQNDKPSTNKKDGRGDAAVPPARHPHILTRSHFFILNETRHFDRVAYDKQHDKLAQQSCGQLISNIRPTMTMCSRSYDTNGHWETRLAFENNDDVAYGPFVGWLIRGAGPKHLVPLPVSKENCSDPSGDPSTFTIDYTVRLSSLTPARVHMIENFSPVREPQLNETAKEVIAAHDAWELTAGLMGARSAGKHPWTRFTLSAVGLLTDLAKEILHIIYWFTRATTSGISVAGSLLLSAASVLDYIGFGENTWTDAPSLWVAILGLVFYFLTVLGNLKAGLFVFPYELEWRGWLPSGIRRRRWTHKERSTRRLEANIPAALPAASVAAIWVLLYGMGKFDVTVIAAALPRTDPKTPSYLNHDWFHALLMALRTTGNCLQLYVNQMSGTYAGSYALTAYLGLFVRALNLLHYADWMVGPVETRAAIYPHELLDLAVDCVTAYQATTLPRVEQNSEDENEE